MAKNEVYNALLEKVRQYGGYVTTNEDNTPIVAIVVNNKDVHLYARAIFESADDSSPLKLITTGYHCWDIYDYLNAEEIEHLLSRI